MKQQQTISKSEYARRHGWGPSYISKLLAEGKITATADGRINPETADAELEHNRGYTAHGPNGTSLAAVQSDEDEPDRLLVVAWCDFYTATDNLWALSRPKSSTKKWMMDVIRELR